MWVEGGGDKWPPGATINYQTLVLEQSSIRIDDRLIETPFNQALDCGLLTIDQKKKIIYLNPNVHTSHKLQILLLLLP